MDRTYDLTKMHTKQLLTLLRSLYNISFELWSYSTNESERIYKERDKVKDIIKAELATREHIPNKKESKSIRKRKMQERKNLRQRKYVNC